MDHWRATGLEVLTDNRNIGGVRNLVFAYSSVQRYSYQASTVRPMASDLTGHYDRIARLAYRSSSAIEQALESARNNEAPGD